MEKLVVQFKNLSKGSIDPVPVKDGIGNIQIIGSFTETITSGTTRPVRTGLAVIIPKGYLGVLSMDPDATHPPKALMLKNTIHPGEYEKELILEFINVGAYPQKLVKGAPLVRIIVIPELLVDLDKVRAETTKTKPGVKVTKTKE